MLAAINVIKKVSNFRDALSELIRFAEYLGMSVMFSEISEYDPNKKIITIRSRRHLRGKVYDLVHELGHVLSEKYNFGNKKIKDKILFSRNNSFWELEWEYQASIYGDALLMHLN